MVYLWVSMAIPMCMALMSIVCKIDPPPATVWNCWGGCFLHGYVTVYVSYYHFSVVVSYYYSIVIIDID